MKKSIIIILLCGVVASVFAVPARKGAIIRTTADGTKKIVYLHGDAFSHHMTDAEGNWLDEKTLEPMNAETKAAREELNIQRRNARRVYEAEKVGNKPNIAPRGLLILVNFQDKAFETPYDTIHNMLDGNHFTRNYSYEYEDEYGRSKTENVQSEGSARQYFHDQSYGKYNPIFDVVGPYTVSKELAYYGENDDANIGYLIKEACELADADGADFTLYDNDNDGKVDFVYVIYAGYGEADGGPEETIWPHNYDLRYTGQNCKVDGKTIRNYACSNEISYYSQQYNGIGTFCHEFSHVLGLPDLYETNPNPKGLHTPMEWDILDYGPYNNDGNTPPAYSSYERFYMGWLTPRILTTPQAVWLSDLNYGKGDAILLCEGDQHNLIGYDPNPTVFYMLESRRKRGWDKHLPGRGLLITKVSYDASDWMNNRVNNSASKMGVDIIEAKPNYTNYAKSTDAFPYGAKQWVDFNDHDVTEIEYNVSYGVTIFSYRGAYKTAIENVQDSDVSVQKILRDGEVIILRGDKAYDILGREK